MEWQDIFTRIRPILRISDFFFVQSPKEIFLGGVDLFALSLVCYIVYIMFLEVFTLINLFIAFLKFYFINEPHKKLWNTSSQKNLKP
jgi:hypothetical protein